MKLQAKIKITGIIQVKTGLRIGAGNNDFELGSAQLSVIKSKGVPFIPGSSLKGKLRSLLAKYYGSNSVERDPEIIKELFGDAKGKDNGDFRTRLLVRDCSMIKSKNEPLTETKWENVIKRMLGGAENPREVERVPEGSEFSFEIIYDQYDADDSEKLRNHFKHIKLALALLEDDYLGGYGSRGYGKIEFKQVKAMKRKIANDEYAKESEDVTNQFI